MKYTLRPSKRSNYILLIFGIFISSLLIFSSIVGKDEIAILIIGVLLFIGSIFLFIILYSEKYELNDDELIIKTLFSVKVLPINQIKSIKDSHYGLNEPIFIISSDSYQSRMPFNSYNLNKFAQLLRLLKQSNPQIEYDKIVTSFSNKPVKTVGTWTFKRIAVIISIMLILFVIIAIINMIF